MARKTVNKGILLRRQMKKGKYPTRVIGYFLQSNREFVRDEMGRMRNMYDKYIRGKAIEKKINTFDGISTGSFFIDFTEFKPKAKKLEAYRKMKEIIKKAAKAGVISSSMASSFKVGKVIAPVVDGKLAPEGLDYETIDSKAFKKSRKKPKTIAVLAKEIFDYLNSLGYCVGEMKVTKDKSTTTIFKNGKSKKKVTTNTYRTCLLNGGRWFLRVKSYGKSYNISFIHETDSKHTNEYFHSSQMIFDDADKKALVGMLKRFGIKPSLVKTKTSKSKGLKSKSTSITFRGKTFSITGTIPGMSRKRFVETAEKLGGTFKNHITLDTDLLVVGHKPGKGKLAQAEKYGIQLFQIKEAFLF
jgi:NAD-dependent DNA ligase